MTYEGKLSEFDLSKPLEIVDVGKYLSKNLYAGQTIIAEIMDVKKDETFTEKLVIELAIDGVKDYKIMRLSKVDLNNLIKLLGNLPLNWIGKKIKIEFSEKHKWIDTSSGQEREGAQCKFFKI